MGSVWKVRGKCVEVCRECVGSAWECMGSAQKVLMEAVLEVVGSAELSANTCEFAQQVCLSDCS